MITVRPACAADIPAIAALFRAYAASLDVDLGYQGFEAELAALPGAYTPPTGALLIAVATDGSHLGCVAMRRLAEPGTCEMKRLHTCPAARGRGVGRALALAVIGAARDAGYRAMRLDTLPDMAAAQRLYASLGFEATAPYYASPVAGTIFMRKHLLPGT